MKSLIIINALASMGVFIYAYKKDRDSRFFFTIITLILPVFGLIFLIGTKALNMKNKDKEVYDIDTLNFDEEINYKNFFIDIASPNTLENESDIAPSLDVLFLNEVHLRRKLVIELIKEDVLENISYIKNALKDKDSETSHYAAAYIAELKGKYSATLHTLEERLNDDECSEENIDNYLNFMKRYLQSGLLENKSLKRYSAIYSEKLKEALKNTNDEELFMEKIVCDIKNNDIKSAEKYCLKFAENFPKSECMYLVKLYLYYNKRDYEKFNHTIDALKKSGLRLSSETRDCIRYLEEGGGSH